MIHFLPGMGATSALYGKEWRLAYPSGQFIDWPEFQNELTLPELAKRIIRENSINEGDTVVGTSLGGMMACEISNQLRLERVVLIASCIRCEGVNRIISLFHPFINVTPIKLIQCLAGKIPMELTQMLKASDADFIRSMCKAIFKWEGLKSDVLTTVIHGRKDLVIPLPKQCDYVLQGGHLLVATHAEECIAILL